VPEIKKRRAVAPPSVKTALLLVYFPPDRFSDTPVSFFSGTLSAYICLAKKGRKSHFVGVQVYFMDAGYHFVDKRFFCID
jgi:hypothetical protein